MIVQRVCFGFLLAFVPLALAQDIEMRVELTSPLGTGISRKGDPVSARVLSPQSLQGDTVEGKVNDCRSGNKLAGSAVLSFSFDTLRHGPQTVPIAAEVRSILNSHGQQDVDEEGRVIHRSSSNLAKVAGGTGLGGLIGGLAGGGKGAAIGALAGATVSLILVEVAADGPSIRLAAGSQLVLMAKARSGPPLSSLSPNAAPAPVQPEPAMPATVSTAARPAVAAPPNPQSAAPGQPDLTALKADFIPGEKVIFYDDFTDMPGDAPPPHWKIRGTVAELKVAQGIRQMTIKVDNDAILTPNLSGLPRNFTMETDLTMEGRDPDSRPEAKWNFLDKAGNTVLYFAAKIPNATGWDINFRAGEDNLGEMRAAADWSQVVKTALWIQNGRLRFYVNGQRVIDVNDVKLPEIATVQEHWWTGEKSIGYRFARFAESTPDFSQAISSSGRFVTHGILFDTDSDRIRPESAAVIRSIASGLEVNPNLKLTIEGYTDSTGNADHNLELSKRRAEAVRAVLVAEFNVEESRLTSSGMGAANPIDSNDTPQGRAQNRRVELVRQ